MDGRRILLSWRNSSWRKSKWKIQGIEVSHQIQGLVITVAPTLISGAEAEAQEGRAGTRAVLVSPCTQHSATSGITAHALSVIIVGGGTHARIVPMPGSWVNHTSPHLILVQELEGSKANRGHSSRHKFYQNFNPSYNNDFNANFKSSQAEIKSDFMNFNVDFMSNQAEFQGDIRWSTEDFLHAHRLVSASGKYNYEGCQIPIPTSIRYDRLRAALGQNITSKDKRVLDLLKFGMPIDCHGNVGCKMQQKNHFSALMFKDAIDNYLEKNISMQAMLGPFSMSPIPDLCFSPLMSVPKDDGKRRVIVDFSFPPGRAINDGISKTTYLEHTIHFCLPSVFSMICRLNELGPGCLMYKRDLQSAFRQFCTDPGDYKFAGVSWNGECFIDTRLAMGLRSSAYCCQSVTEMVARAVSVHAHILVYLDDFGGAELVSKAAASFEYLGKALSHFGLTEAPEKAVAPTTKMDWLGITFDSVEWTMALKASKLQELLVNLPLLLKAKRVKKVTLQKILGSLVWASAVVRAGVVFFNRLLALLRKLKRPHHSVHFSVESKKDISWWLQTLRQFNGKCPIPPAIWTPLTSFYTDASLDGFGMVWGSRAMAGLFTSEFDSLDISKKEMLTVMVAIKHWFCDLANSKVKIFVDNQAVVALLNYGITKSPFLASCLREINFFLAKFNIEIKAEYITSKNNHLADLCSRAFSNDTYHRNFNSLLQNKTLVLENFCYDKFKFEHEY